MKELEELIVKYKEGDITFEDLMEKIKNRNEVDTAFFKLKLISKIINVISES